MLLTRKRPRGFRAAQALHRERSGAAPSAAGPGGGGAACRGAPSTERGGRAGELSHARMTAKAVGSALGHAAPWAAAGAQAADGQHLDPRMPGVSALPTDGVMVAGRPRAAPLRASPIPPATALAETPVRAAAAAAAVAAPTPAGATAPRVGVSSGAQSSAADVPLVGELVGGGCDDPRAAGVGLAAPDAAPPARPARRAPVKAGPAPPASQQPWRERPEGAVGPGVACVRARLRLSALSAHVGRGEVAARAGRSHVPDAG